MANKTKPEYAPNPAHGHVIKIPGKTREPEDAKLVYARAIEGQPVEGKPPNWYGMSSSGQIYRFSPANDGTVHFSGMTGSGGLRFENIPIEVRRALGKVR